VGWVRVALDLPALAADTLRRRVAVLLVGRPAAVELLEHGVVHLATEAFLYGGQVRQEV
jgi:hypothetical protein